MKQTKMLYLSLLAVALSGVSGSLGAMEDEGASKQEDLITFEEQTSANSPVSSTETPQEESVEKTTNEEEETPTEVIGAQPVVEQPAVAQSQSGNSAEPSDHPATIQTDSPVSLTEAPQEDPVVEGETPTELSQDPNVAAQEELEKEAIQEEGQPKEPESVVEKLKKQQDFYLTLKAKESTPTEIPQEGPVEEATEEEGETPTEATAATTKTNEPAALDAMSRVEPDIIFFEGIGTGLAIDHSYSKEQNAAIIRDFLLMHKEAQAASTKQVIAEKSATAPVVTNDAPSALDASVVPTAQPVVEKQPAELEKGQTASYWSAAMSTIRRSLGAGEKEPLKPTEGVSGAGVGGNLGASVDDDDALRTTASQLGKKTVILPRPYSDSSVVPTDEQPAAEKQPVKLGQKTVMLPNGSPAQVPNDSLPQDGNASNEQEELNQEEEHKEDKKVGGAVTGKSKWSKVAAGAGIAVVASAVGTGLYYTAPAGSGDIHQDRKSLVVTHLKNGNYEYAFQTFNDFAMHAWSAADLRQIKRLVSAGIKRQVRLENEIADDNLYQNREAFAYGTLGSAVTTGGLIAAKLVSATRLPRVEKAFKGLSIAGFASTTVLLGLTGYGFLEQRQHDAAPDNQTYLRKMLELIEQLENKNNN